MIFERIRPCLITILSREIEDGYKNRRYKIGFLKTKEVCGRFESKMKEELRNGRVSGTCVGMN